MARSQRRQSKVLACAGLMCLVTGIASAQDFDNTGIVRITDMPSAAMQAGVLPTSCDQKVAGACLDPNSCVGTGAMGVACQCGPGACGCNAATGQSCGCQNGGHCRNCPGGAGHDVYGNGWGYAFGLSGYCPFGGAHCKGCGTCGGKLSMSMRKILAWVDPCSGVCSYSPMHGFTPPGKRPYFRQPVSYQHNYPASWTGGVPSGYHGHRPAVYTPTDTTQLGYYYQKVPTWVPVPGMIPPAPQPGEWHYYGPNAAAYVPHSSVESIGEPTEAGDAAEGAGEETAPMPPEAKIDAINLERQVSQPRLLPIRSVQ